MKYLQRETAIENTQRFFSQTKGDVITLDEAFTAWGRDMTKVEENRAWFSNKLTNLKYHNLVKPVYHLRNSRRVLEKVQLTMEGKKALGLINESTGAPVMQSEEKRETNGNVSFEDAMKIIAKLRQDHPEFEVTFDVKLKNG